MSEGPLTDVGASLAMAAAAEAAIAATSAASCAVPPAPMHDITRELTDQDDGFRTPAKRRRVAGVIACSQDVVSETPEVGAQAPVTNSSVDSSPGVELQSSTYFSGVDRALALTGSYPIEASPASWPAVQPRLPFGKAEAAHRVYANDITLHLRALEQARLQPLLALSPHDDDEVADARAVAVDLAVNLCNVLSEPVLVVGELEWPNWSAATLQLTVSLLDRAIAALQLAPSELHVAGLACLFIALKYEGDYITCEDLALLSETCRFPADVEYGEEASEHTMTCAEQCQLCDDLLAMEARVLYGLGFEVSTWTTAAAWLEHYCALAAAADDDDDDAYDHAVQTKDGRREADVVGGLAGFLTDLSLYEASLTQRFAPSVVAAAALRLARHTRDLPPWSASLEAASGYKAADPHVEACVRCLHELHRAPRRGKDGRLSAIFATHDGPERGRVTRIRPATSYPPTAERV